MPKAEDFDQFYATTSGRLVGQLFAMTGDLHEAQDAVQEAYIRAWQRWPRIQEYHDREAWIRTVAYRISVNAWSKARKTAFNYLRIFAKSNLRLISSSINI